MNAATTKTNSPRFVLDAVDLTKHYVLPREKMFMKVQTIEAVKGISFRIRQGRSLGLVGESGCGKSTLARLVTGLEDPTSGSVRIAGSNIHQISKNALRKLRREFQIVFQDPFGSLDPRHTIGRIVAEPLRTLEQVSPTESQKRVLSVMEDVGLKATDIQKYPHEFSGGQRQRIAIARALITRPKLVVADEPVSALDVSVQAQILNLLNDLQQEYELSYLLISHDLAVVECVCDDVAVMHNGVFVEYGLTSELFRDPKHDYTKSLLDAVLPLPGNYPG
jgi:peptide/nickel transport system ATP-binding protein